MEQELVAYVYDAVKTALTERLGHQNYLAIDEKAYAPQYMSADL